MKLPRNHWNEACAGCSKNASLQRAAVTTMAILILMAALLGFAASPGIAQGGSQPPDYFTDCDKEKFEQLPQTAQDGILEQTDREQQKNALDSAAGAVGANCTGEEDPTTANDLSEEEDLGEQGEQRDEQQDENQAQTREDEQSDEEYAQEGSLDEDDGGGLVVGMFTSIIDFVSERVGEAAANEAADFLTGAAFSLPTPEGELRSMYDQVSNIMKPGAVLLVLITGLMMTLRGANYSTAYATQSALPKIVFFIAGLAFFPEIMNMLSTWSQSFADAVIGTSELDGAFERVISNTLTPGSTIFTGIILFATLFLLIGLVIVCALKSFLFGVLFIVGPLAMFLYPIRNFSGLTSAWFKGVLACFVIPILWVIEIRIGTTFIESPQILLGDAPGLGVYSAVMVVVLTYAMLKTPFMVIQYCFYGNAGGGGLVGHMGRAAVTATMIGAGRKVLTGDKD